MYVLFFPRIIQRSLLKPYLKNRKNQGDLLVEDVIYFCMGWSYLAFGQYLNKLINITSNLTQSTTVCSLDDFAKKIDFNWFLKINIY